jgi:hypothetical protein
MPVKDCELDGKSGYKWGDEGKCYTYSPNNEGSRRTAKKSALLQGIAIGDNDLLPKGHPKSDKK